jgi:hypothetical protein
MPLLPTLAGETPTNTPMVGGRVIVEPDAD